MFQNWQRLYCIDENGYLNKAPMGKIRKGLLILSWILVPFCAVNILPALAIWAINSFLALREAPTRWIRVYHIAVIALCVILGIWVLAKR